jgi:hypothetical protein
MKKFISSKIILGILALAMVGFLSSCLGNGNNRGATVLQVALQLRGVTSIAGGDTTLTSGSDSLTITTLRLVHGDSHLIHQSDTRTDTLIYNPTVVTFSTQPGSAGGLTGNTQGLSLSRGNQFAGLYNEMDFKIVQAPDSKNGSFPGVFYQGGNYSMIIQGTYNKSNFTFKSERNFQQQLPLSLQLQQNKNATILIYTDVRKWFLNNNGGFYDPSDTTNTSAINDNIQGSFQITTCGSGKPCPRD